MVHCSGWRAFLQRIAMPGRQQYRPREEPARKPRSLLRLRPTARVFGNLTTPVLVVEDGALFEGHCSMNVESKKDLDLIPTIAKQERLASQAATAGDKQG
jgi:hypothetical protein